MANCRRRASTISRAFSTPLGLRSTPPTRWSTGRTATAWTTTHAGCCCPCCCRSQLRPVRAPVSAELFARTAAFVQHAWNGPAGRFRNFMAFDRRWLEEFGSEDSHARAVWTLGAVVRYSEGQQPRAWAYGLLERATKPVAAFTSPRAWAFALLGTVDYLDKRPEDPEIRRLARGACRAPARPPARQSVPGLDLV